MCRHLLIHSYTTVADIVFGLLSNSLFGKIFATFSTPNNQLGPNLQRYLIQCSGKVESFLLAGIPIGTGGNEITLNLFRNKGQLITYAGVGLNNITATEFPNLYRVRNSNSDFVVERGDTIKMVLDRNHQTSEFNLSHILFDDTQVFVNVQSGAVYAEDFPLFSLMMSSGEDIIGYYVFAVTIISALQVVIVVMIPFFTALKV